MQGIFSARSPCVLFPISRMVKMLLSVVVIMLGYLLTRSFSLFVKSLYGSSCATVFLFFFRKALALRLLRMGVRRFIVQGSISLRVHTGHIEIRDFGPNGALTGGGPPHATCERTVDGPAHGWAARSADRPCAGHSAPLSRRASRRLNAAHQAQNGPRSRGPFCSSACVLLDVISVSLRSSVALPVHRRDPSHDRCGSTSH
jgi:hypothetical protein